MTRYIGVIAWAISICTVALVMSAFYVIDRRLDRLEAEFPPRSSMTGKVITIVDK